MTNINILSYILSLIGLGTATETETNIDQDEANCSFLSSSTCFVDSFNQEDQDEKWLMKKSLLNDGVIQNWLNQLSNAALCQILTSAITDYPQVADTIQSYYFGRKYAEKGPDQDRWVSELVALGKKAKKIAHSLDQCRISDQFSRASEVAVSLHLLLCQFTQDVSVHGRSHVALFGLILIAQESLNTPTEVRQQIFSHDKFGRVLTLEMTSVLKNFKLPLLPNEDWFQIAPQKENWIVSLEQVCLKMARYDVTWEYRKEYQDVPTIAARYYKHYAN
ncbi:unnamed protein product [Rhizopus stolonifer]